MTNPKLVIHMMRSLGHHQNHLHLS